MHSILSYETECKCLLSCFEEVLEPTYINALTFGKSIFILADLNSKTLRDCPKKICTN